MTDNWDSKKQSFKQWATEWTEPRHIDLRPSRTDPRWIEQEERLAPKEPEFT